VKVHRETWERISSRANPLLKSLRSALRTGRPDAAGFCAVEGVHAVREALAARLDVSAVVASDAAEAFIEDTDSRIPSRARRYVVSRRLFDTIADTETPQGVAAMVRLPSWKEDDLFAGRAPMVLVLDGVQDPGNLGAILRSAEAFRATGVFLTRSSVRRTNAKVLRAAAGSLFRLPIVEGADAQQAVVLARQRGLRIFAAVPREGRPPAMVDFRGGVALAIGAEGPGLSPEVAALADERVTVPMASPVESLNAAVAASVLLYEAARQRSSRLDTIGAST
jgi:TrmH family RNA methyltransferase